MQGFEDMDYGTSTLLKFQSVCQLCHILSGNYRYFENFFQVTLLIMKLNDEMKCFNDVGLLSRDGVQMEILIPQQKCLVHMFNIKSKQ